MVRFRVSVTSSRRDEALASWTRQWLAYLAIFFAVWPDQVSSRIQRPDPLAIAVILSVTRSTPLPVRPFETLDTPTSLDLGPSGRLEVLHLRTCERWTVEGGHVSIGFDGITATGRVARKETDRCPDLEPTAVLGTIGGAILRDGLIATPEPDLVALSIDKGLTRGSSRNEFLIRISSKLKASVVILNQRTSGELDLAFGPRAITTEPLIVPLRIAPGTRGRLIAFARDETKTTCVNGLSQQSWRSARSLKDARSLISKERELRNCSPNVEFIPSAILYYFQP